MAKKNSFRVVPVEKLKWYCDKSVFKFKTTDELEPRSVIIGQDRALKAIKLGLDVEGMGYNIYICGMVGTGRTTTIEHLLKEIIKSKKTPPDLCYIHNFKDPDAPLMVELPAGNGKKLQKDMSELVSFLRKKIPLLFEGEAYASKQKEIAEKFRKKEKELYQQYEQKVKDAGFIIIQVQAGPYTKPDIAPVVQGSPINLEQLENLVDEGQFDKEEFERIREKYFNLKNEMEKIFKEARQLEKDLQSAIEQLDAEFVLPLIKDSIHELKEKYKNGKLHQYFDDVQKSIIENLQRFRAKPEKIPLPIPGLSLPAPEDHFIEYSVNVIVDNSETKGAPVIVENYPTYRNLMGTIERVSDRAGAWRTDFTRIKAGSFIKANGGYLIVNALDLLSEPGSWQALKRSLRNRCVELQSYDPFFFLNYTSLKPEPIKIDVKVAFIGDAFLYDLLYEYDADFKRIFKIKADFDTVMPNNKNNVQEYATFVRKIVHEHNLMPFDADGVSAIVEYGARLAGRRNKLSTRFNEISDIIREANYWAKRDKSKIITRKYVAKAISAREERLAMIDDKLHERILEDIILIDTKGKKVGQVNGLAVYSTGEYMFGKPARITAKVSLGQAGIINIEREAKLSGKTFDKAMLIIAGFLRSRYAQDKPLTLTASIAFEQSYGMIEGDSASCAEIFALLSAISDIPLRQDIAVTGSVNQHGEVQAIGAVNHKIEGFFRLCKDRGLKGTEGVIIPSKNIEDLMLKDEVIEAVKKGKFTIYAIDDVDEGIEILTGMKAGKKDKNGKYPPGTVNYIVNEKLYNLAIKIKEFDKKGEEVKKEEKEE